MIVKYIYCKWAHAYSYLAVTTNVVIMLSHLLNLLMLRLLGQCVPSLNCTVCGLDKICAELIIQGFTRVMTAAVVPKFICGSQHPDLCLQMRGWLLWPVFRSYSKFVICLCGLWFIFFFGVLASHYGGLFSCTAVSDFKIWKGYKKAVLREQSTSIFFKYSMWWDQCKLL